MFMNTDYKIYLAPMEGVTDAPLRKILTKHGNFDSCTSEFIRVTDVPLPKKTLIKEVPELANSSKTDSGTLVRVQFLGDDAKAMLITAQRAVELGATYIDINFGCPSRFVHHSGSMLLKEPELLHDIVSTMRDGLDNSIKLSVKIRTGFADKSECKDIIQAIAVEGIEEIIIHARTRKDLYAKEALDWSVIADMHEYANNIPLVANGDIVCYDSFLRCVEQSLCSRFMIGRAALMIPNIGYVLKQEQQAYSNAQIIAVILEFFELLVELKFQTKSILDRTKQFFGYARINNTDMAAIFKEYCKMQDLTQAYNFLLKKAQVI